MLDTVLLDPTAEAQPVVRERLQPPAQIEGLKVALLDIGKARGNVFLDRLEQGLTERGLVVERFAKPKPKALLLGMNPGPWGMAQTGVPFGEVSFARDFLGLELPVKRPKDEHPKRPVDGFGCTRSEVSGQRVWSFVQERFGSPKAFAKHYFIWNYCPLAFLEAGGKNRTPDKLPAAESAPLFDACDRALIEMVEALQPKWLVGVGKFAEDRLKAVFPKRSETIGRVLHPSPASPIANRGWAPQAERDLERLGLPVKA